MANGKKISQGADILRITDLKKPNDIKTPEPEAVGRQAAIEALLALLEASGEENINLEFNLETVSMLYTVVSMGMLVGAAHAPENKAIMLAAGRFRDVVCKLWVQMGLTPEQCELLKQGIVIFEPR